MVPEARIAIGHGQMSEHSLENTMVNFVEGQYDVLVCTTIIETGLDMPNVKDVYKRQGWGGEGGLSHLFFGELCIQSKGPIQG